MNLKQLAKEIGLNEDTDLTSYVDNKLAKATKMDEIDTITFGLETDDEKIVKVYVKHDKADAFEKLISTKLGEIDSIEDALNSVAQEDPEMIIDVEWPNADENEEDTKDDLSDDFNELDDEEIEDDGGSSMEKSVYDNDQEKADKDIKIKQEESMSIGDKFKNKLLKESINEDLDEKKKDDKPQKSISKAFNTIQQKLIYQAVIELGIPESLLSNATYKMSVIRGIKAAAEELESDASRSSVLRSFVKKSISEEIEFDENEQLNESINRNQLKEFFDKIVMLMDKDFPNTKDNSTASTLVNKTTNYNNFFNRIQQNAVSRLNPASNQFNMLNQKLDDIIAKIEEKTKQKTQTQKSIGTEAFVNESKITEAYDIAGISEWDFSKVGDSYQCKVADISFNLDQENTELLLKSISAKKVTTIKSSIGSIVFRPHRGLTKGGLIKPLRGKIAYELESGFVKELSELAIK